MGEWTDEWMDGTCLLFCCCSAADEDDDDGDITPFCLSPYKMIISAIYAAHKATYGDSLLSSLTFDLTPEHTSLVDLGEPGAT